MHRLGRSSLSRNHLVPQLYRQTVWIALFSRVVEMPADVRTIFYFWRWTLVFRLDANRPAVFLEGDYLWPSEFTSATREVPRKPTAARSSTCRPWLPRTPYVYPQQSEQYCK